MATFHQQLPSTTATLPNGKIVFNNDNHTYHVKVINSWVRRVGYGFQISSGMNPQCGVLNPKNAVIFTVSSDALAFRLKDNNRLLIDWAGTPDGSAKQFRREWFEGGGLLRTVFTVYGIVEKPINCMRRRSAYPKKTNFQYNYYCKNISKNSSYITFNIY
uniref:Major sperm protein n=1 Tax=Caenorhabditis japonica TaxID=281687 RepID=A0A2Q4TBP2_CAEJA